MMFAFGTLTIILATNLAFVSVVRATPLVRRDFIAPKIITPNADTVWTVGHVETVTWNTSNFPPDSQITNPIGRVILGHQTNNSLNLDFDHPLASGFKLRDGSVQLTVPDVPPRDDYLIVLYGDSGNTSPAFTITRIAREDASPSRGSSSASPPGSSSSTYYDTPLPSATPASDPSPTSSSVGVPEPSSSASPPPRVLTTTSATSVPALTSSSSYASSARPATSPVSVKSGATSLLTADKSNLMALTSCMAYAFFLLIV